MKFLHQFKGKVFSKRTKCTPYHIDVYRFIEKDRFAD